MPPVHSSHPGFLLPTPEGQPFSVWVEEGCPSFILKPTQRPQSQDPSEKPQGCSLRASRGHLGGNLCWGVRTKKPIHKQIHNQRFPPPSPRRGGWVPQPNLKPWLPALPHLCAYELSRVQLFATPWTVAHQTPLSMGFSSQEYWSGLPFPTLDLSDPVPTFYSKLFVMPPLLL